MGGGLKVCIEKNSCELRWASPLKIHPPAPLFNHNESLRVDLVIYQEVFKNLKACNTQKYDR